MHWLARACAVTVSGTGSGVQASDCEIFHLCTALWKSCRTPLACRLSLTRNKGYRRSETFMHTSNSRVRTPEVVSGQRLSYFSAAFHAHTAAGRGSNSTYLGAMFRVETGEESRRARTNQLGIFLSGFQTSRRGCGEGVYNIQKTSAYFVLL